MAVGWPCSDAVRQVFTCRPSLRAQFIFEQLILEDEVLLEAVAPAHLLVVMDDAVVEVDIRALLILIIGCLWLLMPLRGRTSRIRLAVLHLKPLLCAPQ